MAEMIGLKPELARRAGLLHDIGKAADHELEGGHPKIGADLLKRHGENETVVHAALGHHDQLTTEYPYTLLVATADACSASRPGVTGMRCVCQSAACSSVSAVAMTPASDPVVESSRQSSRARRVTSLMGRRLARRRGRGTKRRLDCVQTVTRLP